MQKKADHELWIRFFVSSLSGSAIPVANKGAMFKNIIDSSSVVDAARLNADIALTVEKERRPAPLTSTQQK